MDKIKVMLLILHFMVLEKNVSSLTLITEEVVVISKENKNITLNCTYKTNSPEEVIPDKNIRWRVKVKNVFKDVAIFSRPGGFQPYIAFNMEDLYKQRTELIAPTPSQLSAVMIIKNPVCTDEGTYQCWIQYNVGQHEIIYVENKTTFVKFNETAEAKEPTEFLVHPSELEEKQSISLTCNADVGRPLGYIQIWKIFQNLTSELINTSNSETENCTEYVNVTLPVTRDDNGAIYRCSSQNNFTQGRGPSRDSSKITVVYGPDKPTITLTPNKMIYFVGDSLTIQCTTDSNPPPVLTWSFRPYNKSEEMPIEHSNRSKILEFVSVQTKNTGTYTCTVKNMVKPGYPNMTFFVSVYVNISEEIYTGCDQCGYIETCQQSNEKTVCVVNIWMPIAVVCMLLSVTFAVSSIVMIRQRKRTQESTATNNILIENRSPSSDATPGEIHGRYISPADLEFGCLPPSVTQEGKGAAYSRL